MNHCNPCGHLVPYVKLQAHRREARVGLEIGFACAGVAFAVGSGRGWRACIFPVFLAALVAVVVPDIVIIIVLIVIIAVIVVAPATARSGGTTECHVVKYCPGGPQQNIGAYETQCLLMDFTVARCVRPSVRLSACVSVSVSVSVRVCE